MKNVKLLMVLPFLAVSTLMGCGNKNNGRPYQEDFLYEEVPAYEPINIALRDKEINFLEFVGFPYKHQIKVADLDNTDAGIRIWYKDNTTTTVPLKMKNIPVEYRHYFGELGEHSIEMLFNDKKEKFEFTIVENPEFRGYKCYFYDRNKKLLDSQVVGYYQTVNYAGKELPAEEEDGDYRYTLEGWDHDVRYIHQDTQFMAKYSKLEKRWYALRIHNWDAVSLSGIVNEEKTKGSALAYLGRINRAVAYYGPTLRLGDEDMELPIEPANYTTYIKDLNETIASELVEYKVDPDYNTKLYGNVSEIVTHPTFATEFNKGYDFKGVKQYLDSGQDVEISALDPFETLITYIGNSFNYLKPIISKDADPGYYRAAVVGSVDVYLDVSFNKLKDKVYEVGTFNQFVIAPVRNTFKLDEQYSIDGNFGPNFDTKLTVNTKSIYNMANMIDWSRW